MSGATDFISSTGMLSGCIGVEYSFQPNSTWNVRVGAVLAIPAIYNLDVTIPAGAAYPEYDQQENPIVAYGFCKLNFPLLLEYYFSLNESWRLNFAGGPQLGYMLSAHGTEAIYFADPANPAFDRKVFQLEANTKATLSDFTVQDY